MNKIAWLILIACGSIIAIDRFIKIKEKTKIIKKDYWYKIIYRTHWFDNF